MNNDEINVVFNVIDEKTLQLEENCTIPAKYLDHAKNVSVGELSKYLICEKSLKDKPIDVKTRIKLDIYGMDEEKVIPTGLPPPYNNLVTKTNRKSKIIIPNGRNMTILQQTKYDNDSDNLSLIIKHRDSKNDPALDVIRGIDINKFIGGSNYWKGKYLKYKSKYIQLKSNNSS